MDVRCEKCNTEYELDESRLKPGGVTVKCTTCGHMFKIRKRSPTQNGIPAVRSAPPSVPPPSAPAPGAPAPRAGSAVPEPRPQTGSGPIDGERNWILRLDNGETRTCRELATLQQWIIAGQVSRDSMISRSGKTWKRLGDIAELASFFVVAEEAREARASQQITPPRMPAVEPPRATVAGMGAVKPPERETVVEPIRAPRPPSAVPPAAPPVPAPQVLAPRPAIAAPPAVAPPLPPPIPAPPPSSPPMPAVAPPERATGAWANDAVAPMGGPEAGPRGGVVRAPTGTTGDGFGGVVRQHGADDAAFTAGRRGGPSNGPELFDPYGGDLPAPKKSGAGLWIALGSLVVIGAAAAVVYFMFLRPSKTEDGGSASTADAAAPAVAIADAGAAPGPDAAVVDGLAELLDGARTQLGRDAAPALIAAEKGLADGGGEDAQALAMRARLLTAQAQLADDEAALVADRKTADKVREERRKLTLAALALAQRAQKAASATPAAAALANVAMADVLRLQGKPAKDVNRYLDAARAATPTEADRVEIALVEAQLALRDKDHARAGTAIAAVDTGANALEQSGDVRGRWLAARLAAATNQADAARAACEAILAAQPDHAAAKALLAKVGGGGGDDPMPPEDQPVDAGVGSGSGSGSGPGPGSGSGVVVPSGSGDPYDRLVAKADKLAEVDCGQAMPYYSKALDEKPSGVEALIGMGYCHIDTKQFHAAQSKFRTALALSPRNKDALRGVAEAYQQQGRVDLAIEAYKRYLDIYPDDERVKRQLERLGGGGAGPTPPDNGSGAPTDKPTEPPTEPPPAPKPDAPPTPDSPPTTP